MSDLPRPLSRMVGIFNFSGGEYEAHSLNIESRIWRDLATLNLKH